MAFVIGFLPPWLTPLTPLEKGGTERLKLEIGRIPENISANFRLHQDIDEIPGLEGTASRHYFKGLGILSRRSGFEFREHTRRPSRDPVNALLSLGYTLLLSRIWSLVETAGLDPP